PAESGARDVQDALDGQESREGGADTDEVGTPLRVGHTDVVKLREAADEARRWDSKYGGGDWRSSMVPECLRVDAAPLLLGAYTDEV
ncbi:sporulation associated protein, partial [Streptomyces nanshensis]